MEQLIARIGEWTKPNYDCDIKILDNDDGKYTIALIDDEGNQHNPFTLQPAQPYNDRTMIELSGGNINSCCIQAIPAAIGSLLIGGC